MNSRVLYFGKFYRFELLMNSGLNTELHSVICVFIENPLIGDLVDFSYLNVFPNMVYDYLMALDLTLLYFTYCLLECFKEIFGSFMLFMVQCTSIFQWSKFLIKVRLYILLSYKLHHVASARIQFWSSYLIDYLRGYL